MSESAVVRMKSIRVFGRMLIVSWACIPQWPTYAYIAYPSGGRHFAVKVYRLYIALLYGKRQNFGS